MNPLAKSFDPLPDGPGTWHTPSSGALPDDLQGTLFRNGPSRYLKSPQPARHPLDGDGMISAYTLTGGRLHFQHRLIQTEALRLNPSEGPRKTRGYGSYRQGGIWGNAFRTHVGNLANTNVVFHGGKLLALFEGGRPHQLDPENLDTLGEYDFNGALGSRFAGAHPALCPRTEDFFNVGNPYQFTRGQPWASLQRVNAQGALVQLQDILLPGRHYFHDVALTPRYLVLLLNPLVLRLTKFVLGRSVAESHAVLDEPTRILVFHRTRLTPAFEVEGPPGFAFHDINAFDDGKDIVVDYCLYPHCPRWFARASDAWREEVLSPEPDAMPYPTRVRISPGRGISHSQRLGEPLEMSSVDPSLAGERHRYTYGIRSLYPRLNTVVKLDTDSGKEQTLSLGPERFPEEPVFVPRRAPTTEDDGYLLFPVFDRTRAQTGLWVVDAKDLSREPIAVVDLPHHVPLSYHGCFVRDFIPRSFWG